MLMTKQMSSNQTTQKALQLLGISLSEPELTALSSGDVVPLGDRNLSEIGSLFILTAAVSASNLGINRRKITFQDLISAFSDSTDHPGIPICSWNASSPSRGQCLRLALIGGVLGFIVVDQPSEWSDMPESIRTEHSTSSELHSSSSKNSLKMSTITQSGRKLEMTGGMSQKDR
jgi:hypothetical protein